MVHVRQTANGENTITVETEYGDSLVLTIVCENSGIYAVHYTKDGEDKAGQFVDSEDAQEFYESSEGDLFDSSDSEFEAKKTDNSGSLRWVKID